MKNQPMWLLATGYLHGASYCAVNAISIAGNFHEFRGSGTIREFFSTKRGVSLVGL